MNKILEETARVYLKDNLLSCKDAQITLFKRMYSFDYKYDREGKSYIPNKSKCNLDKNINQVIDDLPSDKLDWAMQQVERTVKKNA